MSRTKDKAKADQRLAKRISRYESLNATTKVGKGATHLHRPGSRNGRK